MYELKRYTELEYVAYYETAHYLGAGVGSGCFA